MIMNEFKIGDYVRFNLTDFAGYITKFTMNKKGVLACVNSYRLTEEWFYVKDLVHDHSIKT